jgi:hypothetical protein
MVRVRAIVRRRKYFSIAPEVMAALGEVHPYFVRYNVSSPPRSAPRLLAVGFHALTKGARALLRTGAPLAAAAHAVDMPAFWKVRFAPADLNRWPSDYAASAHAPSPACPRWLTNERCPFSVVCREPRCHRRSCEQTARVAMWARRRVLTPLRPIPPLRSITAPLGSPVR